MKYLLVLLILLSTNCFGTEIPPKFFCDKCGVEITLGNSAENEVNCYQWKDRNNKKYRPEYHLCRKHFKAFHLIMQNWTKK
jgi:hypothetical protein